MVAVQSDPGFEGFFFVRRLNSTEKMIVGKDVPLVVAGGVTGHACTNSVALRRRSEAGENVSTAAIATASIARLSTQGSLIKVEYKTE